MGRKDIRVGPDSDSEIAESNLTSPPKDHATQSVATIDYDGFSWQVTLLPECSVSDHIRTSQTFYELPFLEALGQLLPPDCWVVDVGAHIGNHTLYFAAVLGLHVMAFEPNPDAFSALEVNVRLNGLEDLVTCVPLALSDARTTVTMERRWPGDAGTMAVRRLEQGETGEMITVETERLDSYLAVVPRGPVYLKLDVEGHEPAVIRGGASLFEQFKPMVSVEIQDPEMFDEIRDLLGATYVPIGMFNATPTALLGSRSGWTDSLIVDGVNRWETARYAIDLSVSYGKARNWSIENKKRMEAARTEVIQLQEEASALRRLTDLFAGEMTSKHRALQADWLDGFLDLATAASGLPRHAALVSLADAPFPIALLGAVIDSVDLIEWTADRGIRMRRFEQGACAKELFIDPVAGDDLTAAEIAQFVDIESVDSGPIDSMMIIGGESRPGLERSIIEVIGAPYALVSQNPDYHYGRLFALVGAETVFLDSGADIEEWNRRQLLPANRIDASDPTAIATHLVAATANTHPDLALPQVELSDGSKVLLVSYYAPPATPVSVHRLAYWQRKLGELAEHRGRSLDVTWVTATVSARGRPNTVVVADRGPWPASAHRLETIQRLRQLKLDDLGASWSHHVESALEDLGGPYTTVIVSGNPFHYFDLAEFFKNEWDSKVILDFRDPFAYNTRHIYTTDQRAFLIEMERGWVRSADAVISVNQQCLNEVAPDVRTGRHIIANGYDEEIVDHGDPGERSSSTIRIAYSGTIFATLPVDDLLDSLEVGKHRFLHIGRDYSASNAVEHHPVAASLGFLPYDELISKLRTCHAGVVMTSGEQSTQTTKLFDYLACDLDVIIVTKGKANTGDLAAVTKGLSGVFWVMNDPRKLRKFFASYRPDNRRRSERERFSRRQQTEHLLDLILDLEGKRHD